MISSTVSKIARKRAFARAQLGGALVDLPPQLELGFLGQRDVGRDADVADQLALGVAPRLRHRAHPAIFARRAAEARLERDRLCRSPRRRRVSAIIRALIVGMDPRRPVDPPRLLAATPINST